MMIPFQSVISELRKISATKVVCMDWVWGGHHEVEVALINICRSSSVNNYYAREMAIQLNESVAKATTESHQQAMTSSMVPPDSSPFEQQPDEDEEGGKKWAYSSIN